MNTGNLSTLTTVIKFSRKAPEALFKSHQRNRGTHYPAADNFEVVIYHSALLGWNCVAHGANAIPPDIIEKLQLTEVYRKPLSHVFPLDANLVASGVAA